MRQLRYNFFNLIPISDIDNITGYGIYLCSNIVSFVEFCSYVPESGYDIVLCLIACTLLISRPRLSQSITQWLYNLKKFQVEIKSKHNIADIDFILHLFLFKLKICSVGISIYNSQRLKKVSLIS